MPTSRRATRRRSVVGTDVAGVETAVVPATPAPLVPAAVQRESSTAGKGGVRARRTRKRTGNR